MNNQLHIPKISVILPVYNAARYLPMAIDSILHQSFEDFELLAMDDGSSDASASILDAYAADDKRVRVFSRANRGLIATLNELIGRARGVYLARMDADDVSRPDRFYKQVAYLDSHPECVAVGSGSLLINSAGMPITEFLNEQSHEEIDAAHISGAGESRMCHPSVMIRKAAALSAGLYQDQFPYAEDLDFFLRLAEVGKLANLPEVLIDYRQHLQSTCYTHTLEQQASAGGAVQAAYSRRGLEVATAFRRGKAEDATPSDVHRKWAWWALSAGNVATARYHALQAFRRRPLSFTNVKVLACAFRGR